ncbi:MAG: hypothetical protein R2752_11990 [Vicinamibacterales bacterium]
MGAALASCVLTSPTSETPPGDAAEFPPRLERYLTDSVKLTADERGRLIGGLPVTKLLDGDASREVMVFGALWIDAPIRRYVDAVKDIENFERGGPFTRTKRISAPPRLEDFALLRLPDEDVEDLRTCRVGDCVVKLDAPAIQRFRAEVDWGDRDAAQTANGLMRRLALEYVTGYLEGGHERLAVYRDAQRPTFVAEEFRTMTDRMPELTTYMPAVGRYLLEFPKVTLPNSTSFLYWQEADFGLRPTIRINHLTIREGPGDTVVASKMLYATHYFWTGLELRVLLADASRGPGFWLVMVNCSRSDGLSGFTGLFVRRRVRGAVRDGMIAGLQRTKRMLEGNR